MAEEMNIYQKLAKVRKQVEVIQRNKSGYGYKYVSEDEILAKVSGFMDKYGLSLIPGIVHNSSEVSPYNTKKTKRPVKASFMKRMSTKSWSAQTWYLHGSITRIQRNGLMCRGFLSAIKVMAHRALVPG